METRSSAPAAVPALRPSSSLLCVTGTETVPAPAPQPCPLPPHRATAAGGKKRSQAGRGSLGLEETEQPLYPKQRGSQLAQGTAPLPRSPRTRRSPHTTLPSAHQGSSIQKQQRREKVPRFSHQGINEPRL